MGREFTDVCNRCGAMVTKSSESNSSDMVEVKELALLYLSDEYFPGELSRPALIRTGHMYCPDCLVEEIREWTEQIKTLPRSEITVVKAVSLK